MSNIAEKFLQVIYAVAILFLLPSVLHQLIDYAKFDTTITFGIWSFLSVLLLLLGLFKFNNPLGVGLVLSGIYCGSYGSFWFLQDVSDIAKFMLSLLLFFIVIGVLYRMLIKAKVS